MVQDDKALLARLREHGVEFVVIGGVCAVLHGSAAVTFDLDICCPFSIENLRRLERALAGLNPRHRFTPQKIPLEMTEELCARLKNLYLQTDLGALDCLSEVAGIGSYADVVKVSTLWGSESTVRILTLDALILAKRAVGRERDIATVKQLEAIKERTGKT